MSVHAVGSQAPHSVPSLSGGTPSSLQGRINAAMKYFESQGWTHAQAAGIVANLKAESNLDPNIHQNGGGPGYGIGQWEGPRQAAFASWAGHSIQNSTFQEQLEFVQHELTTSEASAGNALKQTHTAAEAGAAVCRYYERPADISGQSAARAQAAQQIAAGTPADPGAPTSPTTPSGPTSSSAPGIYTVVPGDCLSVIAMRHGVSLQALEAANPQFSGNWDLIHPNDIVHIPGGGSANDGAVNDGNGVTGPDGTTTVKGTNAAAIASQYQGRYETDLQKAGVTHAGVPTSESCANFVTSMLAKAGQISSSDHTDSVSQLNQMLRGKGWKQVSLADAKPGDIWICNGANGESHTEIVASNENGKITLIGSNNHPDPGNQQINLDSYSATIAGSFILAPG